MRLRVAALLLRTAGCNSLCSFPCFFLYFVIQSSRSLIIDRSGVTERSLFRANRIPWQQVRDLGVSYAGFGCGRLYFADERLQTNGSGRKLLTGRHCSLLLRRKDLPKAGDILLVCRNYTRVRPFLCSEEERLVGKIFLRRR